MPQFTVIAHPMTGNKALIDVGLMSFYIISIVSNLIILSPAISFPKSRPNPFVLLIYNKSIPIPIPPLMVAGPPKTGTTTLAFTLNKYRDIWKRGGEPQFWVHANYTAQCMPHWTESEWTRFIERYERSEVSLSSLQSAVPSVCNAERFRKMYEMELSVAERRPILCANPMDEQQRSSELPYCWFIEKTPQYSWQPFVSILVSNLLPKTRYLRILRDPAPHIWSNYFHFGGGTVNETQLSFTNDFSLDVLSNSDK